MKILNIIVSQYIVLLLITSNSFANDDTIRTVKIKNLTKLDVKITSKSKIFTKNFFVIGDKYYLTVDNAFCSFVSFGVKKEKYGVLKNAQPKNDYLWIPLFFNDSNAYFYNCGVMKMSYKNKEIEKLDKKILVPEIAWDTIMIARDEAYFDYVNKRIVLTYLCMDRFNLNKNHSICIVYNLETESVIKYWRIDNEIGSLYVDNEVLYYRSNLTKLLHRIKISGMSLIPIFKTKRYESIIGVKNNIIIIEDDSLVKENNKKYHIPKFTLYDVETNVSKTVVVDLSGLNFNKYFKSHYPYDDTFLSGLYFFYEREKQKIFTLFYTDTGAYVGEIDLFTE